MKPKVRLSRAKGGRRLLFIAALQIFLALFEGVVGPKYSNHGDNANGRSHRFHYKTKEVNGCHDYKEIARWINDQVVQTDKLTYFNRRLGQLIQILNGSVPLEHCCFYEKLTMSRIIENVNKLAEANGTFQIQPSGEIGKDLDQILKVMKKIIGKNMKSCWEQLDEAFRELEINLLKQLDELKKSTEQSNKMQNQHGDILKKEQATLKREIKELSEKLGYLEKQLNGDGSSVSKWCSDSEGITKELNSTIHAHKKVTEKEAIKLEKQIQELTEKQNEQINDINNATHTVKSRTENIEKSLKECKQHDAPVQWASSDLEKKIKQLEEATEKFSGQLIPLKNGSYINSTIPLCQPIDSDMLRIENFLANAQRAGDSQRILDLQNETKELQNEMDAFKDCIKNIDNLGDHAKELRSNLNTMNKSCIEHIKILDTSMEELKQRLVKSLDKLKVLMKDNETNKAVSKSTHNDISESVKELQLQLDQAKKDMEQINQEMRETQYQIALLMESCNKKFAELNKSVIAKVQANDKLNERVVTRLDKIEEKLHRRNDSNLEDLENRLNHLENLFEISNKNIEKLLLLPNRINELERLIQNELKKSDSLQAQVSECQMKCKKMDNVDDLIDRLEDLERVVKTTMTTQEPKTSPKVMTPPTRKRRHNSVIGGADYAYSKYGKNWLKQT